MTLLVAHITQNGLRFLADTRISGQSGVLTDAGPKLFPVPIVVGLGGAGSQQSTTTFAFSFAGSTLPALSTHAFCTNVTFNLLAKPGRLPTVEAVAELYRQAGQRYIREVGSRFEGMIGGYCRSTKSYRLFALHVETKEGLYHLSKAELSLADGETAYLMGSGKESFERFRESHAAMPLFDQVEAFVEAEVDPGVGGALQIADIGRLHVEMPLYARVRDGELHADTFLTGVSLADFLDVGGIGIGRRAIGRVKSH